MEHFYRNIPGWSHFTPFYARMVREACNGAEFVEVGSWKGRSAAFMGVEIANSGKAIEFTTIDWGKGSGDKSHVDDPDIVNGTLMETLERNLAPVSDHVRVLQANSVEAAAEFADQSLDLVFLDGSHDCDSVKADIAAWWPKVRPGGVLGGDDARWPGVQEAVNATFPHAFAEGQVKEFWPWWWTRKETP